MKFLRGSLSLIFATICATAIPLLVSLLVLSATVLNETAVKGWLQSSGVYQQLLPGILDTIESSSEPGAGQNLITADTIKEVLPKVLPAGYIQAQLERVVDGVYGWIDGRSDRISFHIPINEKKTEAIAALQQAIAPAVGQLPACVTLSDLTRSQTELSCRPPNVSTDEFASTVASQAVSGARLFEQPLTEASFSIKQSDPISPYLSDIPRYRQWVSQTIMALPVVIAACLAGIFAVANNRLRSYARLGRHIFFASLVTCLIAGGLYVIGGSLRLPSDPSQQQLIEALTPLARTASQSVAGKLALYSLVPTIVGLALWITMRVLLRRREDAHILAKAAAAPSVPPILPPPVS